MRYAFLGVPFDEGNIGKPGSEEGPREFRLASQEYFPNWFEFKVDLARDRSIRFHPMFELLERGVDTAAAEAIAHVWEGSDAQYLSFNFNVMDASMAPGVTATEPGGIESREMMRIANLLGARGLRIPVLGCRGVDSERLHSTMATTRTHRCRTLHDGGGGGVDSRSSHHVSSMTLCCSVDQVTRTELPTRIPARAFEVDR